MDALLVILILLTALIGAWIDLVHARRALKHIRRATELAGDPKPVIAAIQYMADDGLGGGPIKKGEV